MVGTHDFAKNRDESRDDWKQVQLLRGSEQCCECIVKFARFTVWVQGIKLITKTYDLRH